MLLSRALEGCFPCIMSMFEDGFFVQVWRGFLDVCDVGNSVIWPCGRCLLMSLFYISNCIGALPVWLRWFTMLTSTVGFKVSPHTCSAVPISPRSGTTLLITGSLGKSRGCFCFQRLFPGGAERCTTPKQRSSRRVPPHAAHDAILVRMRVCSYWLCFVGRIWFSSGRH